MTADPLEAQGEREESTRTKDNERQHRQEEEGPHQRRAAPSARWGPGEKQEERDGAKLRCS